MTAKPDTSMPPALARVETGYPAVSVDTVLQQHIDTDKLVKEVVTKTISNFTELDQTRADQFTGTDIPE